MYIICPPFLPFSLTVRSGGMRQGVSVCILTRPWSQIRNIELFLSSFNIALVPLVNSDHPSNFMFAETFKASWLALL